MTDQKCLPECRHEAGGGRIFVTHAPACKNAKPAEPPKVLTRNQAFLRDLSKPAEPPKVCMICEKAPADSGDWCRACALDDRKPAEPQGEPLIDFEAAAWMVGQITPDDSHNLARAYRALAAEVERLRGRVAELESGQPANYHGWCECYSCRKERAFKEVSHNDR